jgi:hypothetical protein
MEYEPMKLAAPGAAPMWNAAWTVMSGLILVNFLIAIISDAFAVVKERTHKQLAIEQEARDSGFKFPSLFQFCLMENCPSFLLPGDAKKKQANAESHERILELKETLDQVDLEKLWERLLQGVNEEEVAVDSAELCHLFDTEKDARLFIDRIAYLAELAGVEKIEEDGTKQEIDKMQEKVDSLDDLVNSCQGILENAYPALLPHLYPHMYEEVDANEPQAALVDMSLSDMLAQQEGKEPKEDGEANGEENETEATARPNAEIRTKGKRFRKVQNPRRPANDLFKQPPRAGDLRSASTALELKKKQTQKLNTFIGTDSGGKMNLGSLGSAAVDQFLSREPLKKL